MAGGKRAHKVQMNMGEPSGGNRDCGNRSTNMGLNFDLLATETSSRSETYVIWTNQAKQIGRREEWAARNSLSKVEYFHSASDSFLKERSEHQGEDA